LWRGENLGFVEGGELLDDLEFDDELAFDDEVEPFLADGFTLGLDRDRNLSGEGETAEAQLDAHRVLVKSFIQPCPQLLVHFDCCPDHSAGERVQARIRLSIRERSSSS
jgi:hypothetical protein